MSTSIKGATKGFSREAVEELSHRRNEPEWLLKKRLEAWAQYEEMPMPNRKDEEWRRTDIRDLPIDEVAPFGEFTSRLSSRDELPESVKTSLASRG